MTFDIFLVWSDLCPSSCGNSGRLLHAICKYAGERIVAHGPLVIFLKFLVVRFIMGKIIIPSKQIRMI